MKKFTSLTALAVLALATLATSSANAQYGRYGQYGQQGGYNYNNGSNYGHQQRLDWNVQQGTMFQNQRAAAIGGILSGIGGALGSNPRNQQASAILNGIGGGFMQAAGRYDFSQGNIVQSQQGYQNNWGGANVWGGGFRQQNNGWNRGMGGMSNNQFRRR